MAIDESVASFLQELRRPDQLVLEVFTKADKLNAKERDALKRDFPDAIFLSAVKRQGLDQLSEILYHYLYGESHGAS